MRSAFFVLLALCSAYALDVSADNRPTKLAEYEAGEPKAAVDLATGLYTDTNSGNDTVHSVVLALAARYRFLARLELELDALVTYFGFDGAGYPESAGEDALSAGNPFIAGYYVGELGANGYFRIGGGVALPLAPSPDGISRDLDYDDVGSALDHSEPLGVAAATHGFWDRWLYTTDALGFALPAELEWRHDRLVLGTEAAAALLVATDDWPVSDGVEPTDHEFVLQAAGSAAALVSPLTLGARLQLVWLPRSGATDNAQLAFAPFVQTEVGRVGFIYARFVLNVNGPVGVLSGGATFWGLHAGGGARF